uniref:Ninjurin-1-like n=1 Tax=Saccoglossus kowalevskii TaxID=10224 RepID=A0ABM0M4A0_SACKO|nr:PREDICTED: ninjurin-1-like [Saccoglossus kowalevskii]
MAAVSVRQKMAKLISGRTPKVLLNSEHSHTNNHYRQRPILKRGDTVESEHDQRQVEYDIIKQNPEDRNQAQGALPQRREKINTQYSLLKKFNANTYASKKTVTQGMLDIALLTANTSYLNLLCQQYNSGNQPNFFWFLVTLLALSITFQLMTAILLFFKLRYNINKDEQQQRADLFNNIATLLVIVITVLNVFIASFSGSNPARNEASSATHAPVLVTLVSQD